MAALIKFLNRLLPFATPGTPLLQDLVHLAAVCAILYFGPQLQERLRHRNIGHASDVVAEGVHVPHELPAGERDFPPVAHVENELQEEGETDDDDDDDNDDDDVGQDDLDDHNDAPPGNEGLHVPEGQAGPVQNPNLPTVRDVGAKKAKSMARRDQRRAYHEFQRSQGEAQRARDAEGAAEREAALAAERERRRVVEVAIEAKKQREREERRERERRERVGEMRRREMAVELVRDALQARRLCDLWQVAAEVGGDADADWVERLLHGTGILGRKGGMTTIVTEKGWVVQVGEDDMREVYKRALQQHVADEDGRVSYAVLGELLEQVLR